jgi:hypothetical protein
MGIELALPVYSDYSTKLTAHIPIDYRKVLKPGKDAKKCVLLLERWSRAPPSIASTQKFVRFDDPEEADDRLASEQVGRMSSPGFRIARKPENPRI